jgi:hypothetical protein
MSAVGFEILTYTGKMIDPFNPTEDRICIEDIAHALSNICRYGGHCPIHYNVAHHSVIVSKYFAQPDLRLACLLHDAEEAYLGDIPTPLKSRFVGLEDAADNLRRMIFQMFGLDHDLLMESVKVADHDAYHLERMSMWYNSAPDGKKIVPVTQQRAKNMFLSEFSSIRSMMVKK